MEWINIISLGIGIVYATSMMLFLAGWFRYRAFKLSESLPVVKISVLIAVRNEEKNIEKLLDDLLKQSFPQNFFEVIVINDHSTDATAQILSRYHQKHSNFRYILLEGPVSSGKKEAIKEGIKQARFELIITTDGDCRADRNWLLSMAQYYEKYKPAMILGPVIFRDKNKFWKKLLQLEQFSLLGITAGSCGINMPVLSSGANMAFEKQIFKQFSDPLFEQTPSGDDMFLLLNTKILNRDRIRFIKSADAAIYTNPPANLDCFWEQRKRWVSKSRFYADPEVLFAGGIVFLTSLSLFLFFIGAFFSSAFLKSFAILFLLKSTIDFVVLMTVTAFFKKKYLMYYFLPAQILYFAYVTLSGFIGFFGPYYWKGRKWKVEKRKL